MKKALWPADEFRGSRLFAVAVGSVTAPRSNNLLQMKPPDDPTAEPTNGRLWKEASG